MYLVSSEDILMILFIKYATLTKKGIFSATQNLYIYYPHISKATFSPNSLSCMTWLYIQYSVFVSVTVACSHLKSELSKSRMLLINLLTIFLQSVMCTFLPNPRQSHKISLGRTCFHMVGIFIRMFLNFWVTPKKSHWRLEDKSFAHLDRVVFSLVVSPLLH